MGGSHEPVQRDPVQVLAPRWLGGVPEPVDEQLPRSVPAQGKDLHGSVVHLERVRGLEAAHGVRYPLEHEQHGLNLLTFALSYAKYMHMGP